MSVYGTDTLLSTFRSFSRQCSHSEFSRLAPGYLTPLRLMCHGFAYDTPYGIRPTYSAVGSPDLLRPSITQARWYRNINLSSIDYAFRPRLRFRLPRADEPSPGNLRFSVTGILIRFFATHACMVTCMQSTSDHSSASTRIQRSSTTVNKSTVRGFGSGLQSRSSSARYHSTSELLRTL